MFRGTVECTADAFAIVLAHYGIGEPHLTMETEPAWRNTETSEQAVREARAQFARYGFIDEDGRLDPGFRDSLNAACRPRVEYYSWFQMHGETMGIHAAALEQEAVLSVRTGERIRMRRIGPNSLVTELISELPALRPARFTPISLRLSEARAALSGGGGNPGGGYLSSVSGGWSATPAAKLKELFELDQLGGGPVYVAVRDDLNRRTACRHPLTIMDNPAGRILNLITGDGGDGWLLVAPGTPQAIQERLGQLRTTLP